MRKIIKITAILLCFICVFAGCGTKVIDLTIDGSNIVFTSVEDSIEFIDQVHYGKIDYSDYENSATVKAAVNSADLEKVGFVTYFETLADGMTLDCVIIGNGSICYVYDLGLDFTDAGLSESEEYYMNTVTLTSYITDDPETLFDGFYASGDFTKSDDGSYFYGMYGNYGTMSVSIGGENQVFVMYMPITFDSDMMTQASLGKYAFD